MAKRAYSESFSKKSYKKARSYKPTKPRKVGNVEWVKGRLTDGPQAPEEKMADLVITGQTVSSTVPYLVSLTSGLPQTAGSSGRIGERVKFKSLNARINMYSQSSVASGIAFGSWSLVLDKQANGTTSTPAVVYSNTTSNNTQLNRDSIERFQVLARGTIEDALLLTANPGKHFDRYIPLDIGARFTDATNEAISNAIYFVVTTNAPTGNPLLVDCDIRMKWTDE